VREVKLNEEVRPRRVCDVIVQQWGTYDVDSVEKREVQAALVCLRHWRQTSNESRFHEARQQLSRCLGLLANREVSLVMSWKRLALCVRIVRLSIILVP